MVPKQETPVFSVQGHDGQRYTQDDFLGKITVLWFYPKADTPG